MMRIYTLLKAEEPEVKWYQKQQMPFAKILIIEKRGKGFFLNHYSQKGEPAGDTWHQSFEDAKGQAEHDYGPDLGEWKEIPQDVSDSLKYVLENTHKK